MLMKKIYSVFAMALTTLSMSAATNVVEQISAITTFNKINQNAPAVVSCNDGDVMANTLAKAASGIDDFLGTYDWSYYRPLGNGSDEVGELTISKVSDTQVSIVGIYSTVPVLGNVNIAAGTITIEGQDVGQFDITGVSGKCDGKFETMELNSEYEIIPSSKPIVLTLSEDGYSIPETMLFGISVYQGGKLIGWLNLGAFNTIKTQVADTNWEDLGEGTFVESFLSGTYTKTGTSTSTVMVQRSTADKNIIRIVKPFAPVGIPKGYLEINISDPDNVVVPYQNTGLEDNVDGVAYCASFCVFQNIVNENQIVTLKDGVINFPAESMYLRWPEAPADSEYQTDANMFYQGGKNSSSLTLPKDAGVDGIESDNLNAPVEYFNLQGVKVANPANGLYIVRQGNKVTKQVIR